MNKKLILGIGIPVGILFFGIMALILNSVISAEKITAFEVKLKSIPTVKDAVYSMQHPGVPWNNTAIIYVVAPIESGPQLAGIIEDVYKTAHSNNLADTYSLDVLIINAAQVYDHQLGDPNNYTNFHYKHNKEVREIIKEAQQLIGTDRGSDNRFETSKRELDQKYSNE